MLHDGGLFIDTQGRVSSPKLKSDETFCSTWRDGLYVSHDLFDWLPFCLNQVAIHEDPNDSRYAHENDEWIRFEIILEKGKTQ